jgi:hypothetical protein
MGRRAWLELGGLPLVEHHVAFFRWQMNSFSARTGRTGSNSSAKIVILASW